MTDEELKLKNETDVANLLEVELIVQDEVQAGEQFPLTVKVRLADQHREQADEILDQVLRHRWYSGVDVKQPKMPRFDDGNQNGKCGEGLFYKVFKYASYAGLFKNDYELVFEGKLRAPNEPQEQYDITARIRNGGTGGSSSWDPQYTDVKIVRVVKR